MNNIGKSGLNIPGTLPNSHSFQILVSSGIPTLDKLLGDGLAVGTLTVIEEDSQSNYARIMLKYFLAEGVANKHSIFFATQEVDPEEIVTRLPGLVKDDIPDTKNTNKEQMKIAFRYSNLPTSDPQVKQEFGHYFDLSITLSKKEFENVYVCCWKKKSHTNSAFRCFNNPAYGDLLETIKSELKKGQYFVNDNPETRNILKIGIYGLGSPLWMSENKSDSIQDINKFFLCLRALLRSAFAVAVVSIPSHLYDKSAVNRCINASDVAIRLQALAGTELENNKYLSDYQGYFHIDKLAAVNTFVSKHPGPVEYMFKLRRKKFSIEVLHLPPELGDSETKKSTPILGCASNTKHLLEF